MQAICDECNNSTTQSMEDQDQIRNMKISENVTDLNNKLIDFKRAQVCLLDFKNRISIQKNEYSKAKSKKESSLKNKNEITPKLLFNGHPILQLFIYNIPRKLSKAKLFEHLNSHEDLDFSVYRVFNNKIPASAIIDCKNLATSCKLQTLSCLNSLEFKTEKCVARLQIKPDESTYFLGDENSVFDDDVPIWMLKFFANDPALRRVISFLNDENRLNFELAYPEYRSLFQGGILDFRSDFKRYSSSRGHEYIVSDVTSHKLNSILIVKQKVLMSVSILRTLLERYMEANILLRREGKLYLAFVDFRGSMVSSPVFQILSNNFIVSRLTLGKTHDYFDNILIMEELLELEIEENPLARLRFLRHECFQSLISLRLTLCPNLVVANLIRFVSFNQTLMELSVVDCDCNGVQSISWLIQAVLSGCNKLDTFIFAFRKLTSFTMREPFNPEMFNSGTLKHLDLSGNQAMEPILASILENCPKLLTLDVSGIEYSAPCSFDDCPLLKSAKIQHSRFTSNTFATIGYDLEELEVINHMSVKNKQNVTISIEQLSSMLITAHRFTLILYKCKYNLDIWLQKRLTNAGIRFYQTPNRLTILVTENRIPAD